MVGCMAPAPSPGLQMCPTRAGAWTLPPLLSPRKCPCRLPAAEFRLRTGSQQLDLNPCRLDPWLSDCAHLPPHFVSARSLLLVLASPLQPAPASVPLPLATPHACSTVHGRCMMLCSPLPAAASPSVHAWCRPQPLPVPRPTPLTPCSPSRHLSSLLTRMVHSPASQYPAPNPLPSSKTLSQPNPHCFDSRPFVPMLPHSMRATHATWRSNQIRLGGLKGRSGCSWARHGCSQACSSILAARWPRRLLLSLAADIVQALLPAVLLVPCL